MDDSKEPVRALSSSDENPAEADLEHPDDEFPWESLHVPPWVIIAIGLAVIVIGVAATWKAIG